MFARTLLCIVAVSLLMLPGCKGESGPTTVPVKGKVLVDDKPMAGIEVRFFTDKHTGYGVTDDSGNFVLAQGAVPGENKIAFVIRPTGGDVEFNPDEGMDEGQFEAAGGIGNVAPPPASASGPNLHADYGDMEKSKITFNVPDDGTETADFHLRAAGP